MEDGEAPADSNKETKALEDRVNRDKASEAKDRALVVRDSNSRDSEVRDSKDSEDKDRVSVVKVSNSRDSVVRGKDLVVNRVTLSSRMVVRMEFSQRATLTNACA